jgi:peptidoglycan DL-endopeptidase CwlO
MVHAMLRAILCLILGLGAQAQTVQAPSHGKPALIASTDLKDFDSLPADRKKLIETALAVARDSPWLPYTDQGADPAKGGFDCSGAMYFVMRKTGLEPPRASGGQFQWLKENKRLSEVPADAGTLDHPSLKKLQPADLLFWGHPETGRISHVAMYLGMEKKDGLAVMINSTDGRSYRGVQANGYGVYDFRIPKVGSKSTFMGYGTPPGIAVE